MSLLFVAYTVLRQRVSIGRMVTPSRCQWRHSECLQCQIAGLRAYVACSASA